MRRRPGKAARLSPSSLGMTSAAAGSTAERQRDFRTYVEPEIDVLLRVAQTLTGSWVDSEDLVQDTLVRAYRAIDRFDGAHPRAWLLTILRHTHLNSTRRQRPDLAPEGMDLATQRPAFGAWTTASAEETVTDRLLDDDVERAVASLDPRFRTVLMLIDLEQLTYAETAQLLGLPLGTVMSRLSRARARVRTQLCDQPRPRRQP